MSGSGKQLIHGVWINREKWGLKTQTSIKVTGNYLLSNAIFFNIKILSLDGSTKKLRTISLQDTRRKIKIMLNCQRQEKP